MTTWQFRFFGVGCTSHLARVCFNTGGQPVAQTDSDWDGGGGEQMKGWREVGLRCLTWLTQGRPVYEVLNWVPADESVIYNKQAMVKKNTKQKKNKTHLFSSLLLLPPPPACVTHSLISKHRRNENKVGWGGKKSQFDNTDWWYWVVLVLYRLLYTTL